jgi:hypothetical protein
MPNCGLKQINIDMKLISILFAILLLCVLTLPAQAGHSQGNGTCMDDIIHWQNMIEKRSDAPLYEQSKEMQSKAIGAKVTGKTEECETLMEEALRMIRKTGGEYPTE